MISKRFKQLAKQELLVLTEYYMYRYLITIYTDNATKQQSQSNTVLAEYWTWKIYKRISWFKFQMVLWLDWKYCISTNVKVENLMRALRSSSITFSTLNTWLEIKEREDELADAANEFSSSVLIRTQMNYIKPYVLSIFSSS